MRLKTKLSVALLLGTTLLTRQLKAVNEFNYIDETTAITLIDETADAWAAQLGPLKGIGRRVWLIRDPKKKVAPFFLSDPASELMDNDQAAAFCARRGARLASVEELEALGRAMEEDGQYNPHVLSDISGSRVWSSSRSRYNHHSKSHGFYLFRGDQGDVAPSSPRDYHSVRCALVDSTTP